MRETELHASVVIFLAHALPDGAIFHHSPNEGKRGFKAQRDYKRSGAKTGWPDLEIIWRGRAYFIELKAPKKYPTPLQYEVHDRLRLAGSQVAICRSLIEVQLALEVWGFPCKAKIAA